MCGRIWVFDVDYDIELTLARQIDILGNGTVIVGRRVAQSHVRSLMGRPSSGEAFNGLHLPVVWRKFRRVNRDR